MFSKTLPDVHPRHPLTPYTDLHCPVVTARADQLRPSPRRVTGVHERGVALQPLHPLSSLAVPHSHGFVCGRREQHAAEENGCEVPRGRHPSPFPPVLLLSSANNA